MKRLFSSQLFFFLAAFLLLCTAASAQDNQPTQPTPQATPKPAEQRNDLMHQLDLTPDQLQKIRRLNIARKPLMEAAQMRLREATASLDEAIYADVVDDQQLKDRIKEMQSAQAEVARLRITNEIAVRKVLSPDQLVKFRALRKTFEDARRKKMEQRQLDPNTRPDRRRFKNRMNRPTN